MSLIESSVTVNGIRYAIPHEAAQAVHALVKDNTSLRSNLEAANADVQVARGQYQGACDVIKQLEQQIADLTARLEGGGEPFGYWHIGDTEEESDFFLASESGDVRCDKCVVLYAAQPATSAAVAAALMKAADVCDSERVDAAATGEESDHAYNLALTHAKEAILALPRDKTALREVCLEVAGKAWHGRSIFEQGKKTVEAIVDEIIGGVE